MNRARLRWVEHAVALVRGAPRLIREDLRRGTLGPSTAQRDDLREESVIGAGGNSYVYRVRREDVDAMMRRHQGETAPLGTHRDIWAPETLGMPYRRHEDSRQPSIWDGTSSSIEPPKRS
jgi:hypothetical protein